MGAGERAVRSRGGACFEAEAMFVKAHPDLNDEPVSYTHLTLPTK